MKKKELLGKIREITVTLKLSDEPASPADDVPGDKAEGRELDYSVWVKGLSGRYFCLRCAEPLESLNDQDHLPDKCPVCGAMMIRAKYSR